MRKILNFFTLVSVVGMAFSFLTYWVINLNPEKHPPLSHKPFSIIVVIHLSFFALVNLFSYLSAKKGFEITSHVSPSILLFTVLGGMLGHVLSGNYHTGQIINWGQVCVQYGLALNIAAFCASLVGFLKSTKKR